MQSPKRPGPWETILRNRPSNFPDHSDHLALFNLYRDYVKHQYDLINHRTAWYVGMQAFLFGAFAFTIQKKTEIIANHDDKLVCKVYSGFCEAIGQLDVVVTLFCIVGIAVSIVVWRVMRAASDPIGDLFGEWKPIRDALHSKGNIHVPFLTGGMKEKHARVGRKYTMNLPWIIGIIWGLILFVIEVIPIFTGRSHFLYLF